MGSMSEVLEVDHTIPAVEEELHCIFKRSQGTIVSFKGESEWRLVSLPFAIGPRSWWSRTPPF
jgi:hypothetical protein